LVVCVVVVVGWSLLVVFPKRKNGGVVRGAGRGAAAIVILAVVEVDDEKIKLFKALTKQKRLKSKIDVLTKVLFYFEFCLTFSRT
jgi:hypothetical protein